MATKKPTAIKKPSAARKAQSPDPARALAEVQAQLAALSQRLERLEARAAPAAAAEPPAPRAVAPPAPAAGPAPAPAARQEPLAAPGISEEEILAVSAALAAYLGVRLRIRQIRLLSSPAWAQQGRVSIQASHHLHS